ncbi:MAG: transcriptional regulator [Phycisphaerae bacterium]|nr:MAG: transcriptional regulator [Phycisphaerae bacterium]
MPRAATTSDVYNAIAEPQRRAILDYLAAGEYPVNSVVEALEMDQPSVSKHLGLLKEVGLVEVRRAGRQRLYRMNGAGIQTVHDWTKQFERFWDAQLDRDLTH